MSPYEKAMQIIDAEHKIVNTVYKYIDRLNDPDDISDPLIKIATELTKDLEPLIENHLKLLWISTQSNK